MSSSGSLSSGPPSLWTRISMPLTRRSRHLNPTGFPTEDMSSLSYEPLSTRISASNVHTQQQSPLFGTLYPELREIVFRLVLNEYDDLTRPFGKHEYYYRPGFEFAGRIDTNLLLTCRSVYLETHLAPIALNEHVFWMYRAPPGSFSKRSSHNPYFQRMTPQQRAAVRQVRFFAQLFWLEGRRFQEWAAGLAIRKLVITIRHSDWWDWENSAPLYVQPPAEGWAEWVGSIPELQELELEFETIEPKREELEERVRVALGWKFPLKDGGELVHDGEAPARSSWVGTSRMSPQTHGWAPSGYQMDEAALDLNFPIDLKLHVRKFRFIKESRLL